MRKELEDKIGLNLPEPFVRILTAFINKFGGFENGTNKFLNYLNCSYFVHFNEGRSYENTPIEIAPFIATGGDGEHFGYLILAPELELNDFPIVRYSPGGGYVDFLGNTTIDGIEQIISDGHLDSEFEEIDIPFLSSIGIYPSASKAENGYYLLNYNPDNLITPALKIPNDYSYLITHDGIGVLARSELFAKNHKLLDSENNSKEFIEEAQESIDKGYWASALFYLKEAWFYKYHEDTNNIKKLLRDMQMNVYESLGRDVYVKRLKEEYNWL